MTFKKGDIVDVQNVLGTCTVVEANKTHTQVLMYTPAGTQVLGTFPNNHLTWHQTFWQKFHSALSEATQGGDW